MTDPMTRDGFVAFVRDVGQGVVATVDAGGNPEAALVALAITDEAELVFDSLTTARKVRNIHDHHRVAVVVGWDEGVSVQVEGVAQVLSGDERTVYGEVYLSQFPGGRALDDEFSIVRVVPDWLRYYDARHAVARVVERECW
jgi:general stress protein 26